MTLHPTQEELHDLRAGRMPITRRDAEYLLIGVWLGAFAALLILAFGTVSARSDRPAICATYHGAECVAAIEEAR